MIRRVVREGGVNSQTDDIPRESLDDTAHSGANGLALLKSQHGTPAGHVLRNVVPEPGRARPGIEQSVPHECEQILDFMVRQDGGIRNAGVETIKQGLYGSEGSAEIVIESVAAVRLERRTYIQMMSNGRIE